MLKDAVLDLARTDAEDGAGGRVAFPDTLVGTDSHTTMINGLGVLGYGVGGIEAEAVLLGQPLYQPMPRVVGVRLTGELPVDQIASIAEIVAGSWYKDGPGVAEASVETRSTPLLTASPIGPRPRSPNSAPIGSSRSCDPGKLCASASRLPSISRPPSSETSTPPMPPESTAAATARRNEDTPRPASIAPSHDPTMFAINMSGQLPLTEYHRR